MSHILALMWFSPGISLQPVLDTSKMAWTDFWSDSLGSSLMVINDSIIKPKPEMYQDRYFHMRWVRDTVHTNLKKVQVHQESTKIDRYHTKGGWKSLNSIFYKNNSDKDMTALWMQKEIKYNQSSHKNERWRKIQLILEEHLTGYWK